MGAFLEDLGRIGNTKGIGRLTPAAIHAFIVGRADRLSRSDRKTMCTALRGFLRFLLVRGYLRRDLVSCVPVIPSFKLDRLPRGIGWDDVQRILAVIDRSTTVPASARRPAAPHAAALALSHPAVSALP